MFTCVFPSQKYKGFRPDHRLSTMTSRSGGVDATVNAFTGFTYAARSYMQLYFPAIRKDFICTAKNATCVQYFSADELTTGEIPEMENTQQLPRFV